MNPTRRINCVFGCFFFFLINVPTIRHSNDLSKYSTVCNFLFSVFAQWQEEMSLPYPLLCSPPSLTAVCRSVHSSPFVPSAAWRATQDERLPVVKRGPELLPLLQGRTRPAYGTSLAYMLTAIHLTCPEVMNRDSVNRETETSLFVPDIKGKCTEC